MLYLKTLLPRWVAWLFVADCVEPSVHLWVVFVFVNVAAWVLCGDGRSAASRALCWPLACLLCNWQDNTGLLSCRRGAVPEDTSAKVGCVAHCCRLRRAECTLVGGVRVRQCRGMGAVWRWLFSGGAGAWAWAGAVAWAGEVVGVVWRCGHRREEWGVGVGVTLFARYLLVCGDGKEA